MLRRNRAIVVLDVKGNTCERGYSCVHHDSDEYPESAAVHELHASLKENQVLSTFAFMPHVWKAAFTRLQQSSLS